MKFRTKILQGGKTATGIEVPQNIVDGLDAGKRPKVVVTINGYSYRSTVMPYSGKTMLPLSAEHRAGAGVEGGQSVTVELVLDAEERTVAVPKDFAAAMKAVPGARARFDAISFTQRKEHVRAIEDAKTPETRERRIAKAVALLGE